MSLSGNGVAGGSTSTGRSRYSKIRWNSASELCSSTPVWISDTAGRNRVCCNDTNATSVPSEAIGTPSAPLAPAAQ